MEEEEVERILHPENETEEERCVREGAENDVYLSRCYAHDCRFGMAKDSLEAAFKVYPQYAKVPFIDCFHQYLVNITTCDHKKEADENCGESTSKGSYKGCFINPVNPREIAYALEIDNYYDLLDVPRNFQNIQLKSAYREKALKFHPLRNPSERADQVFIRVTEGFHTLMDPCKRKVYDEQLDNDDPASRITLTGCQLDKDNACHQFDMTFGKLPVKDINLDDYTEWHNPLPAVTEYDFPQQRPYIFRTGFGPVYPKKPLEVVVVEKGGEEVKVDDNVNVGAEKEFGRGLMCRLGPTVLYVLGGFKNAFLSLFKITAFDYVMLPLALVYCIYMLWPVKSLPLISFYRNEHYNEARLSQTFKVRYYVNKQMVKEYFWDKTFVESVDLEVEAGYYKLLNFQCKAKRKGEMTKEKMVEFHRLKRKACRLFDSYAKLVEAYYTNKENEQKKDCKGGGEGDSKECVAAP